MEKLVFKQGGKSASRVGKNLEMLRNCSVTKPLYHYKFQKKKSLIAVNDRKYVFHFRPKPKLEKHLALGRIPKAKLKVQIYVKMWEFC